MNTARMILMFLATSLAAGLVGGAAMEGVMAVFARLGGPRANMIVALGGLLTKSRHNAFRVGIVLHVISAIGFAAVYTMLLVALGVTHLLMSVALGAGVGFLHGLIVSLMLVWVVAEGHPLPEFNEAGLSVGLSHLLGHVAFGAAVGFVVGCSPF